jgi:hypothetical protein
MEAQDPLPAGVHRSARLHRVGGRSQLAPALIASGVGIRGSPLRSLDRSSFEPRGRAALRYRVVCDNHAPVDEPEAHAHIVEIGTGSTADHQARLWKVDDVISAIDAGDTFYTASPSTGREALVDVVACEYCGHRIIRSSDALRDQDLDNLPDCLP